jgi:hypothetical protein
MSACRQREVLAGGSPGFDRRCRNLEDRRLRTGTRGEGLRIIILGRRANFDTSDHVKRAATTVVLRGDTKYTALNGTQELKHAIQVVVSNRLFFQETRTSNWHIWHKFGARRSDTTRSDGKLLKTVIGEGAGRTGDLDIRVNA